MNASWTTNKETCLKVINRLQVIAQNKKNQALIELLQETAQRLITEKFTLVVMGEFKRGKSTLINALLGMSLLPTAVVPLTALPTIIEYGEELQVVVNFQDGRRQEIEPDQLAAYVTEKENPSNQKGVREVNIYLPSQFLKPGIIVVDTPGIGSVYQHNTEAAYAYLPRADAALFIFTTEAPLSRAELDYLNSICSQVKKVFFVLNKVDLLTEEEQREVEQFASDTLQAHLGMQDITIYPVSARLGIKARSSGDNQLWRESGMAELENTIMDFLQHGKSHLIFLAATDRALRAVQELQLSLELWRRAMDDDIARLEEKIAVFERERSVLEQEREDCVYLLYREAEKLCKVAEADLDTFRQENLPRLINELETYFWKINGQKISNREMVDLLNDYIENTIRKELTAWRLAEGDKILHLFRGTVQRFFRRVEEIVDRLIQVSAAIFDLPAEQLNISKEYIIGERDFYFYFFADPTFIPSFENLAVSSIFPRRLFGNLFLNHAKKKMSELFERNCGRVRHSFTYGLMEEVRKAMGQLRLRSDAVMFTFQQALNQAAEQKQLTVTEQKPLLAAWEAERAELRDLKTLLTSINTHT